MAPRERRRMSEDDPMADFVETLLSEQEYNGARRIMAGAERPTFKEIRVGGRVVYRSDISPWRVGVVR